MDIFWILVLILLSPIIAPIVVPIMMGLLMVTAVLMGVLLYTSISLYRMVTILGADFKNRTVEQFRKIRIIK